VILSSSWATITAPAAQVKWQVNDVIEFPGGTGLPRPASPMDAEMAGLPE
jgi:hypothetical protein